MNEHERNSRQEQERPLRDSAGDEDLAAIANRALDFALFNRLNTQRLGLPGDRHTGDDRIRLDPTLGRWSIFTAWSSLLRAAFLARVLRNKTVEFEIWYALRTAERLHHLVDCYWFSESGHRGQKQEAKRGAEQPGDARAVMLGTL